MRFRTALTLASLPMIRAFARGARRLRRNVRALAGGAFPSSDRWAPNLVSGDSDTPTTPVLVLQKDEYEAWLGEQAADTQSYLKAAGLAKFKDDALVLLPERKWAFMTKNASSLYAFASLPARLPSDGAVYELESAEQTRDGGAVVGPGLLLVRRLQGHGLAAEGRRPAEVREPRRARGGGRLRDVLEGHLPLPRPDQHAGGGPGARGAGGRRPLCGNQPVS